MDDVEVFGLNFVRLSWIKTESLGDQTLFVGENCCVSVSASKVGCKSNCLYFHFTHNANDGWWLYDMESGGISQGFKGGVIPILRQNHHGLEWTCNGSVILSKINLYILVYWFQVLMFVCALIALLEWIWLIWIKNCSPFCVDIILYLSCMEDFYVPFLPW